MDAALTDLDLLGAPVVCGDAGDDYLRAHPEIPTGPNHRPLRGMLLPLSAAEQAEWRQLFGTSPPGAAYQGPSLEELKKRDAATLNDAERYWIASISGDLATAQHILQTSQLTMERDFAQMDAGLARTEAEVERARRERLEAEQGFFGALGRSAETLKKAAPWVAGGVVVLLIGAWALPVVVPALVRRAVRR